MVAIAGRLPHKGTMIRKALERLHAAPATTRDLAAFIGCSPEQMSAWLAHQRRRGWVLQSDSPRGKAAIFDLTFAARRALAVEAATGQRPVMFPNGRLRLPRQGTRHRVVFDHCATGSATTPQLADALYESTAAIQRVITDLRHRGLVEKVGRIKPGRAWLGVYRATEAALALLPEQRRAA